MDNLIEVCLYSPSEVFTPPDVWSEAYGNLEAKILPQIKMVISKTLANLGLKRKNNIETLFSVEPEYSFPNKNSNSSEIKCIFLNCHCDVGGKKRVAMIYFDNMPKEVHKALFETLSEVSGAEIYSVSDPDKRRLYDLRVMMDKKASEKQGVVR